MSWRALLVLGVGLTAATGTAQTYVGSDACKRCHERHWNDHRVSGHPHMLSTAVNTRAKAVPLPEGYDWSEISYVVGGYRWKAQFLDSNGYFITDVDGGTPGRNQFNLEANQWVDYHAGEPGKRFDCGPCHTTGYSAAGSQGGLPGIQGSWELDGVQCERCHGPGSAHIVSPSPFNISLNTSSCRTCHVRGDPDTVSAGDGFVRNQQQYNEILASPHFFLDCAVCHDPHKQAKFSFKVECTLCHDELRRPGKAFRNLGIRHWNRGIGCVECHMPFAVKSAASLNQYRADVRSHLFGVALEKDAEMFDQTGNVASGRLTAAYVCLGCHQNIVDKYAALGKPLKAEQWARKHARKIHK